MRLPGDWVEGQADSRKRLKVEHVGAPASLLIACRTSDGRTRTLWNVDRQIGKPLTFGQQSKCFSLGNMSSMVEARPRRSGVRHEWVGRREVPGRRPDRRRQQVGVESPSEVDFSPPFRRPSLLS